MSPLARHAVSLDTLARDQDPVLAALLCAPVVPFTDEERAMIAEAMRDPRGWQSADKFMAKVAALAPI